MGSKTLSNCVGALFKELYIGAKGPGKGTVVSQGFQPMLDCSMNTFSNTIIFAHLPPNICNQCSFTLTKIANLYNSNVDSQVGI